MFSIYRLYLENIANVTIFLVIGTTENFAQGPTMEGVFVANASAWQNTMSPATQPVNAWPQMKPVLPLMVRLNLFMSFCMIINLFILSGNFRTWT